MAAETATLCSALLFVFVFVSADQKNITAESGQNVTLTCRAPNNNIIVGKWTRTDLGSEYVLLYRDNQFDPEHQHPSFKNRVDLQDRQIKDGDVSLILNHVTVNDTGTYECRVAQGTKEPLKLISIIYLSVVDPPGPTGGSTEDGGKEDGRKEDGGKEDGRKKEGGKEGGKEDRVKEDEGKEDGRKEDGGSVGLIVGLIVAAVLLVSAVVGILIYRNHNQQDQSSYQPPVELQPV